MVALGFLFGLWTASRRALHDGLSAEQILDSGVWLIVGTIVGARFWYVTSYWHEEFAGKPFYEVFMIHHGGLVFYGGLVGASVGCILYAKLKKLPLWKLADALAPSVALGHGLGRVGCLMNGCCYGRICDLPWAIHFPKGQPSYPNAVHPTQIYESMLDLALYAALAWLYRRKKFNGQVFAVYLIAYAFVRSFVELFRGDYPQYYFGWITPAHVVSGIILLAGLILWRLLPRPAPHRG
jgi:phosphatidylglycerol:prolipoprotein diacylglycerol transferase